MQLHPALHMRRNVSFMPELDNLTLDQLIERFRGACPDGAEYAVTYYMEVGNRIALTGDAGLAALRTEVARVEDDTARLRGVLTGLLWTPRARYPEIRGLIYSHLHDSRDTIVCGAIWALGDFEDQAARDTVLAYRNHTSGSLRGAALYYLQHSFPDEAVPAALAALDDEHFVVRETAIDVLDELGVAGEYLDRIRPLLKDPHEHVRQAAEWAISSAAYIAGNADTTE
jgi:hypothetical protein